MMWIAGIDSLPCTVLTLPPRHPFESALPASHRALPARISSHPIRPSLPASAAVTPLGLNVLPPPSILGHFPAAAPPSLLLLHPSRPVFPPCARLALLHRPSKTTSQNPLLTHMTSALFPLCRRAGVPTLPSLRGAVHNLLQPAPGPSGVPLANRPSVVGVIQVLGPTHSISLDGLRKPSNSRVTGTVILVHRPDRLSMTVFSSPPSHMTLTRELHPTAAIQLMSPT
jgi:hypothetical protein